MGIEEGEYEGEYVGIEEGECEGEYVGIEEGKYEGIEDEGIEEGE